MVEFKVKQNSDRHGKDSTKNEKNTVFAVKIWSWPNLVLFRVTSYIGSTDI